MVYSVLITIDSNVHLIQGLDFKRILSINGENKIHPVVIQDKKKHSFRFQLYNK